MATRRIELGAQDLRTLEQFSKRHPHLSVAQGHTGLLSAQIWRFEWRIADPEAARAWNEGWEVAATRPERGHPALRLWEAPAHPIQRLLLRIGTGVLTEAVIANGVFPRAEAGWTFQGVVEHRHQSQLHPACAARLTLSVAGFLFDAAGDLQWTVEPAPCAYPRGTSSDECADLLARVRVASLAHEYRLGPAAIR